MLDFYSDLVWSTLQLSEAGVTFDGGTLHRLDVQLKRECESLQARVSFPLEGKGSATALRSRMDAAIRLCPALTHHPSWEWTAKGKPSAGRLNRLLANYHLPESAPLRREFDTVNAFHRARDMRSRFTSKLPAFGIPDSGGRFAVYPSWHITPSPFKDAAGDEGGTAQGRITCTSPPLQTLPAEVKKCLCSRYDGGTLLWIDLAQIEWRVAGVLSGDPYICSVVRDGRDCHTELAVAIAGAAVLDNPHFKTGDNRRDPRQSFKNVRFLSLYGGGWCKAQQTILRKFELLVADDTLERAVSLIREQQKVWFQWVAARLAECARSGVVRLPITGLRRHLDTSDDTDRLAVGNVYVQAFAAQVMERLMEVWRDLPNGVRMCLNVYDGLLFDCPPGTLSLTRTALEARLDWLRTDDLWAALCSHYGTHLPLEAECYEQK